MTFAARSHRQHVRFPSRNRSLATKTTTTRRSLAPAPTHPSAHDAWKTSNETHERLQGRYNQTHWKFAGNAQTQSAQSARSLQSAQSTHRTEPRRENDHDLHTKQATRQKRGNMKITVDTPEAIAAKAAQRYVELLAEKPAAVLGFATGSTPLGLYAELARLNTAGEISFKGVTSFNLDEYVGLDPTHPQSYRYFMEHNLFEHIDIDLAATHVPSGLDTSADALAGYDKAIAQAGGLDLQLLGIGINGHIGFNEPGTPLESLTHVVELTESTREANKRFFGSIDEVPTHAATMGIKTVMNARGIMLIATGENKADAIAATVNGPVTAEVPASVLQLHPNVELYLDEAAASKL